MTRKAKELGLYSKEWQNIFFLHRIHISSYVHPAPYPKDSGASFLRNLVTNMGLTTFLTIELG